MYRSVLVPLDIHDSDGCLRIVRHAECSVLVVRS